MAKRNRKTIRFKGKHEPVLDTIHVRGRTYFVLEKLSRRGAFRVFDRHAGPDGDYRILYQFPMKKLPYQKLEVVRGLFGNKANKNFPQLVDFASAKENTCVVLSWVWGTNLRDYLRAIREKKTPRPTIREVIRLFRGLVHGVSHYHARSQVIHGDISPANIILTSGTKQLVLVDFGSAWPIEMSPTRQAGDGITPLYSAPERMSKGAAEDFRSDVFSLAVVAYELMTLEPPYDGLGGRAATIAEAGTKQLDLVLPSKHLSFHWKTTKLARRLGDELFSNSLALEPDHRFSTRTDWLTAWDALHRELQQGTRLTGWQESLVNAIERVTNIALLKRKN